MPLVNPGLYTDREKQDLDSVDYKPYRQSIYFEFNSSLRTSKTVIRLPKDCLITVPLILNVIEPFDFDGGIKLGFPGYRDTQPKDRDIFFFSAVALFGPYVITQAIGAIFVGVAIGAIQKEETDIVLGFTPGNNQKLPTRGSAFIMLEYINMQRVPGYRR